MSVAQTKKIILERLEEIRHAQATRSPPRHVDMPPPPPSPPPRRRGWFDRSPRTAPRANSVEGRLAGLEERLIAVERCFVQLAAPERRGELPTRPRPSAHDVEAVTDAPTVAKRQQVPENTGADAAFDFGGEPYRLTGDVHDGLITDVLQMLTSNQKTGRFSLFLQDRQQRYDIFFNEGELVHARAGELEGEAAFFSLMTMAHQEGQYGFLEEALPNTSRTIAAKTQFLILEALRRIDEESQGEGKDHEKA